MGNSLAWIVVAAVALLAAGGVAAAMGMGGWGGMQAGYGGMMDDSHTGTGMMDTSSTGYEDHYREMHEHMEAMHGSGCMDEYGGDEHPRGQRLGERAWGIAAHIEEATNYTGVVVKVDPARALILVQLDDGRNVTFKLHRVYVEPTTGYLVMGGWIADNIEGSTVTITGLGTENAKLALAIYLDWQQYMVPQYYLAIQNSS